MSKKILVIGQAPPAPGVKQTRPYDTTMFYDWLDEAKIIMTPAINGIFEFEALYDKFPGHSVGGGHLVPSKDQMNEYYLRKLESQIKKHDLILVMGAPAKKFLDGKLMGKRVWYTMHPSKRNWDTYHRNPEPTIKALKEIFNAYQRQ